jgi:hypothetical protein
MLIIKGKYSETSSIYEYTGASQTSTSIYPCASTRLGSRAEAHGPSWAKKDSAGSETSIAAISFRELMMHGTPAAEGGLRVCYPLGPRAGSSENETLDDFNHLRALAGNRGGLGGPH